MNSIELPLSFVSKTKFELNEKEIRLGGVNNNEQWDGFEHFFYEKTVSGGGNEDYFTLAPGPFGPISWAVAFQAQNSEIWSEAMQAINGSLGPSDP